MPDPIVIVIDLPVVPKILRPNYTIGSFAGRMAKASAIKKYRKACEMIARAGECPRWVLAEIEITLRLGKGCKEQDPDNIIASMKSGIDGLVDAGVLAGDRKVTYASPRQVRDWENPGVTVRITRA